MTTWLGLRLWASKLLVECEILPGREKKRLGSIARHYINEYTVGVGGQKK